MKTTKTKNWEPEYKYETLTGKFIDYCGNTRDFTMVAVSVPTAKLKTNLKVVQSETVEIAHDELGSTSIVGYIDNPICDITKYLTIGVAVRNTTDEYDADLAVRIAYGKALALHNHILFVSHPGMINTKMVNALLEQEASYFMKDPGSYIKGYNADRDRYLTTGKIAAAEMPAEMPAENGKTDTDNQKKAHKIYFD